MQIENLLDLLPSSYSSKDHELIQRAYKVADQAHKDQRRASGEPYVNHCVAVAGILAEMRVPPNVIAAALMHDTVEDTPVTIEEIKSDFGSEIARLVDGVTKLTQLPRVTRGDQHIEKNSQEDEDRSTAERRGLPDPEEEAKKITKSRRYDLVSETLRKTFLAMGEDVNVVLIKLADRLHNMRTLGFMPEHKQLRIAQETLDIFAPLANRLGIWNIKWELEDLGFRYVNPQRYKDIANSLTSRLIQREKEMNGIKSKLLNLLKQAGINSEISARSKHIFSIYRKMERKGIPFDLVYDVRGIRIIVPDIPACYSTLGVIHTHWRPIPGEFDDYIAVPKDNFYRSLHTAVVYDDGNTLEIQIRTPEMHINAEYGIAAHWRYKEGSAKDDDYERRILWLRSLMEWRQEIDDAKEFLDSMKTDVFQDRVYVFTPKGDIIDLPSGSTPIDFAYHVHTDIGNRCRGVKINGKLVTLEYILKTGDKVEIITAKRGGPSRDWLNANLGLVKTQRAKAKIRHWFKRQAREQNINQGKNILEKELRRLGMLDVNLERLAKEYDYRSIDDLYEAIGCGDFSIGRLINHLTLSEVDKGDYLATISSQRPAFDKTRTDESVSVLGLKGLLSNFARCCNPVPGDEIIGYITRGRGASIHRIDCPNILRNRDKERLVKVTWGEPKNTYPIPIRIKAYDRNGLMRDVSTLISDEGINMSSVSVETSKNLAVFQMILEVHDILELSRVLDRLENLPNVTEAIRLRPG